MKRDVRVWQTSSGKWGISADGMVSTGFDTREAAIKWATAILRGSEYDARARESAELVEIEV